MMIGTSLSLQSNRRAPGPAISSFATWNPADKRPAINLSGDNLTASLSAGGSWASLRATRGRNGGKFYFEIQATNAGGGDGPIIGLGLISTPLDNFNPTESATVRTDLGYLYSNGSFSHNNTGVGGIHGAVFRFAVDIGAGKAWISGAAGAWFNSGDPENGVNPQVNFTPGLMVYPLTGHYETDSASIANFGQAAFSGAVPPGFTPGW